MLREIRPDGGGPRLAAALPGTRKSKGSAARSGPAFWRAARSNRSTQPPRGSYRGTTPWP